MVKEIDWAYWERRAPWLPIARKVGAPHVEPDLTEAGDLSLVLANYAQRRRWIRIAREAHMTVKKGDAQRFIDDYVPNAKIIENRKNTYTEVFYVELADLNQLMASGDTMERFLRESLASRMKALR